ncbi:Asp-tRNA(Asn)/Glu-tRNA(Gln) amidotransferase subunit GatC [Facklamia miroungae]|uniref:Aspartyl/glutamyl-tRNA(Asn/Gln) amidotransferase subunit C n=1 Tax=Facklamia miroungae TaxID=120956 RepID=A0A1G7TGZ0_9LACT|nr:Asp-tRNA(Asn)/Glu-tRNA(Gln) amidotransferase subunit GatC [Facklamia miroungae]NKZ29841.1 Asp-tRNA(Asn)/Glu-tRNA(Gln) amidotransferase subunit GatC [Facklamia miroungae]SDG34461.1 aspartyl-tRNA(Asn)/glutamyl-tRNA(Gln) amidotransferase subunit C [Facklamia miroungae]
MITREDIQHVAQLAKLSFSEEELDQFTPNIQEIIGMVEQLQEVETEGIAPTYHGNQLKNIYREDVAVENATYQELLKNAPTAKDGYIQVPVIIEDEKGA